MMCPGALAAASRRNDGSGSRCPALAVPRTADISTRNIAPRRQERTGQTLPDVALASSSHRDHPPLALSSRAARGAGGLLERRQARRAPGGSVSGASRTRMARTVTVAGHHPPPSASRPSPTEGGRRPRTMAGLQGGRLGFHPVPGWRRASRFRVAPGHEDGATRHACEAVRPGSSARSSRAAR